MTNCFLIADEVGLGKTKSAKTVLFEMIRLKQNHDVHAIYIASSSELSRQNMESEFLPDSEEPDKNKIGNRDTNYRGLAGFQKANAEKVLKSFFENYPDDSTGDTEQTYEGYICNVGIIITKGKDKGKKRDIRLSEYLPELCEEKQAYIMSLSPRTSFSEPSISTSNFGNEYMGSDSERGSLQNVFLALINKLKGEKTETTDIKLLTELEYAVKYELNLKNEKINIIDKCQKIHDSLDENQSVFFEARRIRNNASVALYKPELIILDEFQRYRNILESTSNGYSILEMVKYLKERFACENFAPKILLLSATPYNYNSAVMEPIQWIYETNDDQDSYEASTQESEKPFEDFNTLLKCMKNLGAWGHEYSDCIARTERNMFKKEHSNECGDISFDGAEMCNQIAYQNEYLNPLVQYCIDQNFSEDDLKIICSEIGESPEFWRFNFGYQKRTIINDINKIELLSKKINGYSVDKNLGLQQIKKQVFPEDCIPRLWVPPVSSGETKCGKMLVFTTMQVTTRSVSYFVDQIAQEKVKQYTTTYENESIDCQDEDFKEFIKTAFPDDTNVTEDAFEVMAAFFNRKFVKCVIAADMSTKKMSMNYFCAVKKYCDDYKFKDMIEEYKTVLGKNYKLEKLIQAFKHLPTSIIQWDVKNGKKEKTFTNIDYSEMFVCDDNKAGNEKATGKKDKSNNTGNRTNESLNVICDHFNSPIYPMVLVARNSGQEGFNLQYYGDKLMHWQKATSVNGFLQREGRLNRPGSLIFRQKVWKYVEKNCPNDEVNNYFKAKKAFDEHFEKNYTSLGIEKSDFESGLYPMWNFNYEDIAIKQIFPLYEYGSSFNGFITQIVSANQYSKFHNDVNSLCPYLSK